MDKITRLLLLYSRLISGEKVNKKSFCNEVQCLPRSFDRDIEDIRLFLSELYISDELVYSRTSNAYFLRKIDLCKRQNEGKEIHNYGKPSG